MEHCQGVGVVFPPSPSREGCWTLNSLPTCSGKEFICTPPGRYLLLELTLGYGTCYANLSLRNPCQWLNSSHTHLYRLFQESVSVCEDSLEMQGQVWAPEGKADSQKPYHYSNPESGDPPQALQEVPPVTLTGESLHTLSLSVGSEMVQGLESDCPRFQSQSGHWPAHFGQGP